MRRVCRRADVRQMAPETAGLVMLRTLLIAPITAAFVFTASASDLPRTKDGQPNLSGYYDIATLTPLERPRILGDAAFITRGQAEKVAADAATRRDATKLPKTATPNGVHRQKGVTDPAGLPATLGATTRSGSTTVPTPFRLTANSERHLSRLPQMAVCPRCFRQRKSA